MLGRYGYRGKGATSLDPALERVFQQQRDRVRHHLETVHARYERRIAQIDPARAVETRGSKQAWRRDSADGYGAHSEW